MPREALVKGLPVRINARLWPKVRFLGEAKADRPANPLLWFGIAAVGFVFRIRKNFFPS